jgi:glycine/D-amino acid oxidase-like deaminating enzyme
MSGRRTIAVVGAGVIGSSIAWHLRQMAQHEVLLIDTHLPLVGASAYSAGILRRHHSLHSDIALATESLRWYRQSAALLGHDGGYTAQGFLLILRPESAADAAVHRAYLDELGSATDLLDTEELRRRYPYMRFADGEFGILEPDGGFGSAAQTAHAFRLDFAARGGTTMLGVRVSDLAPRAGRWLLRTNIGDLVADDVVLAAGAASARLAAPLGLELPVTPRRIGLVVIRPAERLAEGPVVIDDCTGTYFVPRPDSTVAVGVRARPECADAALAEPLTSSEVAEALSRGAQRVPSFATAPARGSQAACDGYTPDTRPILGCVDGLVGLHLACGFSGGGYKIAPAVGRHVAAGICQDGPASAEIASYNVRRFASGALLGSDRPYGYL